MSREVPGISISPKALWAALSELVRRSAPCWLVIRPTSTAARWHFLASLCSQPQDSCRSSCSCRKPEMDQETDYDKARHHDPCELKRPHKLRDALHCPPH